jgi:2-keto-4-pentenoate hydratase/2-oxohepta-3-ene-1,7-dioic acid hydratase in catechol pathway
MQFARPSKVVCIGLNYVDHASEVAMTLPDRPLTFAKWPNAIIGTGEEIVIPTGIGRVDYEAELAVVIGRATRDASAETALDAVAAYTCLNDVSARDEQFSGLGRARPGAEPEAQSWQARAAAATDLRAHPVCRADAPAAQDESMGSRANGRRLRIARTASDAAVDLRLHRRSGRPGAGP